MMIHCRHDQREREDPPLKTFIFSQGRKQKKRHLQNEQTVSNLVPKPMYNTFRIRPRAITPMIHPSSFHQQASQLQYIPYFQLEPRTKICSLSSKLKNIRRCTRIIPLTVLNLEYLYFKFPQKYRGKYYKLFNHFFKQLELHFSLWQLSLFPSFPFFAFLLLWPSALRLPTPLQTYDQ